MPTETRHILGVFEDAISDLKSDIQRMGHLAQANLDHAVKGLLERNADLCNRTIADDEHVDELEKEIDSEGVEIIMKFGPVAKDLRRVISTMKAATAIERISDHAVAFARRAKHINQHPAIPATEELRGIYELAAAMLRDAVSSFCEGDLQAALMIQGRDTSLDAAYREFNKRITDRMQGDAANIPVYVDLLFCARFIERIGDQSVNIAEDAVYLLTAMDIRHGGELPMVKKD
jgi:phosphate transport system protein